MASTFTQGFQPWWIFNDKFGKPLAGGKIYTYDSLTRDPKATYLDAAGINPETNPIELDGAGMFENAVYFEENGTSLYYIEIYDRNDIFERAENNVPASGSGGGGPINEFFESINYVDNMDFKFNYGNIAHPPVGDTPIAPGGWFFRKAENFATDNLVFVKLGNSTLFPHHPQYFLDYSASSFSGSETEKAVLKRVNNVAAFSNEEVTFNFSAFSTISGAVGEIMIYQYFGTGGSPSSPHIQLIPFTFPSITTQIQETFIVDSIASKSIGTNGDDYMAYGIRYPLSTPGSFAFTGFGFIRGTLFPPNGFFDTPEQTYAKCIQDEISKLFPFYTTGYTVYYYVDYGIIKGGARKYAIDGFLGLEDQTIGSSTSGAVDADNKYKTLFIYLWRSNADIYCPVSGGRGVSADADWAANKTLRLPQAMGRAVAVAGAGSGLTPRAIAEYVGEQTHLLTPPEMPSHNHALSLGNITVQGSSSSPTPILGSFSGSRPTTFTGGDVPHNIMQPTTFVYGYIKY